MSSSFSRRSFVALLGGLATSLLISGPVAAGERIGRLVLSEDQWRKRLSSTQFDVLRRAGTETPFTSPLVDEHRKGIFSCAGCKLGLFDASTKYDSHTGWPSFYRALPGTTKNVKDTTFGEVRTEVRCVRCDGHLGHVFDDGPQPTGLRYCMNGVALAFTAK